MPAWPCSNPLLVGALVAAASTPISDLAAQSTPHGFPRGTHAYNVTGIFQGEPMEPWTAELMVGDSASPEGRVIIVEHRSRRAGKAFLFTDRAVMSPEGTIVGWSQISRGRVPSQLDVSVVGGRMRGRVTSEGTTREIDEAAPASAVPAFALGVALASRELKAGDTVRVGVLPLAPGGGLFTLRAFAGAVRDDAHARSFGSGAEPVWAIVGDGSYPAEVWVAKADRQVLKLVLPQGTVGIMIEEYAGKASP